MNRIDRKLNSIINSKLDIKSAIAEKGVSGVTEVLSTYADKIREIQGGSGGKVYEVETTWDLNELICQSVTIPEELMVEPTWSELPEGQDFYYEMINYVIKTVISVPEINDFEIYGVINDILSVDGYGKYCIRNISFPLMAETEEQNAFRTFCESDGEEFSGWDELETISLSGDIKLQFYCNGYTPVNEETPSNEPDYIEIGDVITSYPQDLDNNGYNGYLVNVRKSGYQYGNGVMVTTYYSDIEHQKVYIEGDRSRLLYSERRHTQSSGWTEWTAFADAAPAKEITVNEQMKVVTYPVEWDTYIEVPGSHSWYSECVKLDWGGVYVYGYFDAIGRGDQRLRFNDGTTGIEAIRTYDETDPSNKHWTEWVTNIYQPTELTGLTVTSNGTYTAPEGKAYSGVTVNVPTGETLYYIELNKGDISYFPREVFDSFLNGTLPIKCYDQTYGSTSYYTLRAYNTSYPYTQFILNEPGEYYKREYDHDHSIWERWIYYK